MLEQPAVTITSTPGVGSEEIAGRSFPIVRRGFEPDAVRRFLEEVAGVVRGQRQRELELSARLADAERRAAAPELDEATLTAAVGLETARVLQAAHEAARELIAKAEERASELVGEAATVLGHRQAEAEAEAQVVLEKARAEGAMIVENVTAQCRSMVDEAREARRRILADLADRRRRLHVQLEQLRAGKDTLERIVDTAASAVDSLRSRLSGAEEEARTAAGEALGSLDLVDYDGFESVSDELVAEILFVESSAAHQAEAESPSPVEYEPEALDEGIEPAPPAEEIPAAEAPGVEIEEAPGAEIEEAPGVEIDETPAAASAAPSPEAAVDEVPVATTPETVAEPPEVDAGASSPVDELFARIRASRAEEVTKAHGVLAGAAAAGSPVDDSAEGSAAAGSPVDDSAEGSAAAGRAAEERAAEADGVVEVPGAGDTGAGAAPVPSEEPSSPGAGDRAHLARRDELLGARVEDLSRSLKRSLREDQNELLDRLRNLKGGSPADLLPGDESRERIFSSGIDALTAAHGAGEAFARWTSSGGTAAPAEEAESAEARSAAEVLMGSLAAEIVEVLRTRMEASLAEAGGVDESFAEVVGAVFREWRGERVERLAGDFAAEAFARGTVASASASGATVRWIADDGDGGCPDCDDNALAEPLDAGEPFPTGHVVPPVHPGCRCLLVPVVA